MSALEAGSGMSEEGREAIKKANRERNLKCGKCGALSLETVDGSAIGGLPGIQYRYCPGCGWSTSVFDRLRRKKRGL